MGQIPNVSAKSFTISAMVIGYLLIDDTTAEEQNALGNWLMLVAQVLCTNGFYKQLQNSRAKTNYPNDGETIIMMQKMINALNREISDIKSRM